ncbi:hypothetical protein ACH5RR_031590 [Cinchona calisaya]|uniref:Uncharacterized protein n=1 Tax=Cinchona calisaya TaxID=153742 RepID=A0ABD2YKX6_9GENT
MSTFRHQYNPIPNDSGQSEEIPLVSFKRKPIRRICQCPHFVLAEIGEKEKLQPSHPRFGPFYREDESEVSGKKAAWDKILEKSPDNKNKTLESYLSAMRRIEKEARDAYGGDKILYNYNLTQSEFRWMMIQDGCFFLLLALLILGVSPNQLGYPDKHIIFGKKDNEEDVKRWIESMFFVGNQIPLVVLNELMKQSFLQAIVQRVKNWEIPSDLSKKILYNLLVLPALEYANNQVTITSPLPVDLLDALHRLMIGPGDLISMDLVENETTEDDLEAGAEKGYSKGDISISATELSKKGIHFGIVEEGGCTEIDFKDYFLFPRLYLPTFTVDDDTELLCKSLKYYEISQKHCNGEGKMSQVMRSYLQFMNDLICTYEDVKILEKRGIIRANNPYTKEKLPMMLNKLAGKDKKTTTHKLHMLRIKLRDYNIAPWEKFKIVAILLFVFTVIQTFLAALSYIKPPK